MSRLKWDQTGERYYELGVRNTVLYVMDDLGQYKPGVAWNGVTEISENREGGDPNKHYADDLIYCITRGAEEYCLTINAFQSPVEFDECDGEAYINGVNGGARIGQQKRRMFGIAYRTAVGNDIVGEDAGYKLHVVYGCTASPTEKTYTTINDSPDPQELSWEVDCLPVTLDIEGLTGIRPFSDMVFDSRYADPELMTQLEDMLYGTSTTTPRLPSPEELYNLFKAA